MWWDDKFSLRDDGETLERLWWPLIAHHFPQYERFWRKHIVPLTNRINPDFSKSQEDWLSFRSDPAIGPHVEQMAMAQYSTFYYITRSALLIMYEPHLYVEDAFVFLNLAIVNCRDFLRICRQELARELDIRPSLFPWHNQIFNLPFSTEIKAYRDVIIHAPKIGRAYGFSREFVPKTAHLQQAERSWRYVQGLGAGEFEDGRILLRRLLTDLLKEVGASWERVERALEPARTRAKYRSCWNLDGHYCIPGKQPSR